VKFAPVDTFSRLQMVSLGDAVGIALGDAAELAAGFGNPPRNSMVMGRSFDPSMKPIFLILGNLRTSST
jgi:hypothetical protein